MTTEKFIQHARRVHGDKYDYSKVVYKNTYTKVCIICPKHGEFWQKPAYHIQHEGCPLCGQETTHNARRRTKEQFIELANKVHNFKYDYSKVEYNHSLTKVCIICPEHGEFWQRPNQHLQGSGCPLCAKNLKMNTDSFIEKAKKVHGDKYDYSKVEYVSSIQKVCIVCPEHGEFWQTPSNHLHGQGCPKCGRIQVGLKLKKEKPKEKS